MQTPKRTHRLTTAAVESYVMRRTNTKFAYSGPLSLYSVILLMRRRWIGCAADRQAPTTHAARRGTVACESTAKHLGLEARTRTAVDAHAMSLRVMGLVEHSELTESRDPNARTQHRKHSLRERHLHARSSTRT